MKRVLLSLLMLIALVSCGSGEHFLQVENSSSLDRVGEIVEVEIEDADAYAVFDAAGRAIQCQTTYEGNLIFPATVAAGEKVTYTLRRAERPELEIIATGREYEEWYNNYAWENDKIAFRAYHEDIGKYGQTLYGFDVITKRGSKYPVLDILFGTQFDKEYQKIRKDLGKGGSELSAAISIHIDHGLGMDYYAVGPTLGSGTAALIQDGETVYPTYFVKSEILDAGGLRNTFKLTFAPMKIGDDTVVEERIVSLDAGTHFNRVEVYYNSLTKKSDAIIGIVLHDNGEVSQITDSSIAYAEPVHKYGWQTYNAVIYPEDMTAGLYLFSDDERKAHGGAFGYLQTLGEVTPSEPLVYYMGAGWNRWGFETPQDWFDHVRDAEVQMNEPLTVTMK